MESEWKNTSKYSMKPLSMNIILLLVLQLIKLADLTKESINNQNHTNESTKFHQQQIGGNILFTKFDKQLIHFIINNFKTKICNKSIIKQTKFLKNIVENLKKNIRKIKTLMV